LAQGGGGSRRHLSLAGLFATTMGGLCARRGEPAFENPKALHNVKAPSLAFQLMSPYPQARPLPQKMALADYRGKPTVLHLYTG